MTIHVKGVAKKLKLQKSFMEVAQRRSHLLDKPDNVILMPGILTKTERQK